MLAGASIKPSVSNIMLCLDTTFRSFLVGQTFNNLCTFFSSSAPFFCVAGASEMERNYFIFYFFTYSVPFQFFNCVQVILLEKSMKMPCYKKTHSHESLACHGVLTAQIKFCMFLTIHNLQR